MKNVILLLTIFLSFPLLAKGIVFIVHPDCQMKKLTRSQIRDMYFKKNRNWPERTPIRFFDRPEDSEARQIFIREVLNRSSRQVDRFWIEQKFKSGDSAPSTVDNNQVLQDLISRFPGSISYLPDDVPLSKNVKVIEVTGAE